MRLSSGRVCNATEDVQAVQLQRRFGQEFNSASHFACASCRGKLSGQFQ
jgi:hypothetical protein